MRFRRFAPVSGLVALAACSDAGPGRRPIIGVVQIASIAPLDQVREGFYRALADSGFVRDVRVTFVERNAQGDVPTLALIMREFERQGVTHVATISSVAAQAAMKAFTDRPIVFGAVANPYVIGAGTSPTSHRPNVTGVIVPQPVDSALALGREVFPTIAVWGTPPGPVRRASLHRGDAVHPRARGGAAGATGVRSGRAE